MNTKTKPSPLNLPIALMPLRGAGFYDAEACPVRTTEQCLEVVRRVNRFDVILSLLAESLPIVSAYDFHDPNGESCGSDLPNKIRAALAAESEGGE